MKFFALATLLTMVSSAPAPAVLESREQVLSETFPWPISSHAGGINGLGYQITRVSSSSHRVACFNNAETGIFAYKVATATGSPEFVTLGPGMSTSFTVRQDGTDVTVTIDTA